MSTGLNQIERIHILGVGNLGKFLAHSLKKANPSLPVTLFFHRQSLVDQWQQENQQITVTTNGSTNIQGGFDVELLTQQHDEKIKNLIVATKTHMTKAALEPLVSRLDTRSRLLFLQNGMGTIDEVQSSLFTRHELQPEIWAGIISHGVYNTKPFSIVHAGLASTTIGRVTNSSSGSEQEDVAGTNQLTQAIINNQTLNTTAVLPTELLQVQLRKLTINAVINPLSVVYDCINGDVFTNPDGPATIDTLLTEISSVTQAILREANASDDVLDQFSKDNLQLVIDDIGPKVAKNISSMRQDVLAGRRTEIDYINGYIVHKAKELGFSVPCNSELVALVKQKEAQR